MLIFRTISDPGSLGTLVGLDRCVADYFWTPIGGRCPRVSLRNPHLGRQTLSCRKFQASEELAWFQLLSIAAVSVGESRALR